MLHPNRNESGGVAKQIIEAVENDAGYVDGLGIEGHWY